MRIRFSFAGSFLILIAIAGYTNLSQQPDAVTSNKPLHVITFFVLTTCFYWILDTSRRRSLNFTLVTCTGILGVGFELLQNFLPSGHKFDFYDIITNVTSSLAALGLSSWYHARMLERKRKAKQYLSVSMEDDLELETGIRNESLDSDSVSMAPLPAGLNQRADIEEEINRVDKDIREGMNGVEDGVDTKKRAD